MSRRRRRKLGVGMPTQIVAAYGFLLPLGERLRAFKEARAAAGRLLTILTSEPQCDGSPKGTRDDDAIAHSVGHADHGRLRNRPRTRCRSTDCLPARGDLSARHRSCGACRIARHSPRRHRTRLTRLESDDGLADKLRLLWSWQCDNRDFRRLDVDGAVRRRHVDGSSSQTAGLTPPSLAQPAASASSPTGMVVAPFRSMQIPFGATELGGGGLSPLPPSATTPTSTTQASAISASSGAPAPSAAFGMAPAATTQSGTTGGF